MNDKQKKVVSSIVKDFQNKYKRNPKDQKELAQFVQTQGGEKYIQRKTNEVLGKKQTQQEEQTPEQKQKALHGAKLNYFKSLKNQCAEDEEVIYYKKGGSVGCGCKKKEQGGEVPTAKEGSAIAKFKAARKMQKAGKMPPVKVEKNDTVHVNGIPYSITYSDGTKKNLKSPYPKYSHSQYVKDRSDKSNKDAQRRVNKIDKVTRDEEMKCGGKVKKNEEGSKINKSCNGAVAKFKAHRQGGKLQFAL